MENRQGKAEGKKREEDAVIIQIRDTVRSKVVVARMQRVEQSELWRI